MKAKWVLGGLLALAALAGCSKNPAGPSTPDPTPAPTHQVIYVATSTAGDNVITYVDGDGQSHQVHAGTDWAITFTAHQLVTSNNSYYVYLACASVSAEYPMQESKITIFVDGQVYGRATCRRDYTLAWAEKQF